MKSETQIWFCMAARKARVTLSSGQGWAAPGLVVMTFISRPSKQRAMPRASAAQVMADLSYAVSAPAAIKGLCLIAVLSSRSCPARGQFWMTLLCPEGMKRRCCDPRNPADRPDAKDATVIVRKRHHLRNGRSSSAAAKYALAFFRIPLSVRSSRTSHSSFFDPALPGTRQPAAFSSVMFGLLAPDTQAVG